MKDKFPRLKPRRATPRDELCVCPQIQALVLCHALIENPMRCMTCNGEVEPERLNLSAKEIDAIANWNLAYGSVYRLWLESREYERWAREELRAVSSPVNVRGLQCRAMLAEKWPSYYWWFVEEDETHSVCPKCKQALTRRHDWEVCEACKILVPSVVSRRA
jgi:hypothetical protein